MKRMSLMVIPVVIGTMVWLVYRPFEDEWIGLKFILLALAMVVCVALWTWGRFRDAMVVVSSLLVGFAAIESYFVLSKSRGVDIRTPGYSVPQAVLGWGPEHPGVFHQTKLAPRSRAPIFDVDYTIDAKLDRRVIATNGAPSVVFLGDSMTFGTGLPDSETLPQTFADLYDRNIGVTNLGFPGYGPQQVLRGFETGYFDDRLGGRPRLFVYKTAAWHAERSSCAAGFMLRAPRYVLVDGQPRFQGTCYQDWPALPMRLLAQTSLYHALIEPVIGGPSRADIDLYVAIIARAAALARQRFNAPMLVLYLASKSPYLRRSGYTDEEIASRLRSSGVEVIEDPIDPDDVPEALAIPGDGHPTGAANRLWSALIKKHIETSHADLFGPPADCRAKAQGDSGCEATVGANRTGH